MAELPSVCDGVQNSETMRNSLVLNYECPALPLSYRPSAFFELTQRTTVTNLESVRSNGIRRHRRTNQRFDFSNPAIVSSSFLAETGFLR